MIGNAILAFAVIVIVVLFVYMSLRVQQDKKEGRHFQEQYDLTLTSGFRGDSISIYLNDSLLFCGNIEEDSLNLKVFRFDKESALLIVDNNTEKVSLFSLSQEGGRYFFRKSDEGVVEQQ